MDLKPIEQTNASHEVADHIRAQIQSGELGVGRRLPPQRLLAASYSVGRQAVAQALTLLEAEGYVVTRRGAHGGSFVCEPVAPTDVWMQFVRANIEELQEVIDFRIGVERHIATLAARRRTAGDLVQMRAAIDDLPRGTVSRSVFREADGRFHAALSRAARNERLEVALRRARADLFMPTDNMPYVETVELTRRQHLAIFKAIEDGDASGAARAITRHLESTRTNLLSLLEEGP